MTDWTDDEVKKLHGFIQDGLSSNQMGKELNKTRNAILGKIDRLGISRKEEVKKIEEEVAGQNEPVRLTDSVYLPLDRRPTLPLIRCIANQRFLTFRMAPFGDYGHDL